MLWHGADCEVQQVPKQQEQEQEQQWQRPRLCSSSVYLPAYWAWHGIDWQQDLPQLDWQVVSDAYQATHPELAQQWVGLFLQLGVVSMPPVVPRVVAWEDLTQAVKQQQQQEPQEGVRLRQQQDKVVKFQLPSMVEAEQQQQQQRCCSPAATDNPMDTDTPGEDPFTPGLALALPELGYLPARATPAAKTVTGAGQAAAAQRSTPLTVLGAIASRRRMRFRDDERPGREQQLAVGAGAAGVDSSSMLHQSSMGTLVVDWTSPDLEALLASMPVGHGRTGDSTTGVRPGDAKAQHAAMCR